MKPNDKKLICDSKPDQTQPQFDINMTTPVVCEECGSSMFDRSYMLRKVPALIAGKEGVMPIPIFQCRNCGHINENLSPKLQD